MKKAIKLSLLFVCAALLILCRGMRGEGLAAAAGVGQVDLFSFGDPVWTEEGGKVLSLTPQQQYEANIFLSNFSEQRFCEFGTGRFDAAEASEARLFSFAHVWAKINRRSAIGYEGSYETMTLEAVNEIVMRYIDRDDILRPAEGTDYSEELGMGHYDWDRCWYQGGRFYFPAADGESFNRFSVTEEAILYPSNHVLLRFTIYELALPIYRENDGVPSGYYYLTPAEAAQREIRGEITPMRTGAASCSPCRLQASGRESYVLIRYALDE